MTSPNNSPGDMEKSTLERLERLESVAPVTMSRQEYERLYLTPKTPVKGDLRKVFGNPTPLYAVHMASNTSQQSFANLPANGTVP